MYQVLFSNRGDTFAANISKVEYEYLSEATSIQPDLYDVKVSAKSYDGYGDFKTRDELLRWFHEKWYQNMKFDEFISKYESGFENYKRKMRINRVCSGILYYEYNTGVDTEECLRRIGGMIHHFIEQYNVEPTKQNLRKYIRFAMRDYILNS